MEYMESKMQDFYDGWNARIEACAVKTCGCPTGVCDVDDAARKPREVFTVDLDGDLPFQDTGASRKGGEDADI